jgi:hypothetical protein
MAEHLYLPTLFLILGTILIVFVMKYVSAALQARARNANERDLMEEMRGVQAQHKALLSTIQSSVLDISARLGQVEKLLKDVG